MSGTFPIAGNGGTQPFFGVEIISFSGSTLGTALAIKASSTDSFAGETLSLSNSGAELEVSNGTSSQACSTLSISGDDVGITLAGSGLVELNITNRVAMQGTVGSAGYQLVTDTDVYYTISTGGPSGLMMLTIINLETGSSYAYPVVNGYDLFKIKGQNFTPVSVPINNGDTFSIRTTGGDWAVPTSNFWAIDPGATR